jgi:hypothetical protein
MAAGRDVWKGHPVGEMVTTKMLGATITFRNNPAVPEPRIITIENDSDNEHRIIECHDCIVDGPFHQGVGYVFHPVDDDDVIDTRIVLYITYRNMFEPYGRSSPYFWGEGGKEKRKTLEDAFYKQVNRVLRGNILREDGDVFTMHTIMEGFSRDEDTDEMYEFYIDVYRQGKLPQYWSGILCTNVHEPEFSGSEWKMLGVEIIP